MFVKDEGNNGRGWEEGVGGKGQMREFGALPFSEKQIFSQKNKNIFPFIIR